MDVVATAIAINVLATPALVYATTKYHARIVASPMQTVLQVLLVSLEHQLTHVAAPYALALLLALLLSESEAFSKERSTYAILRRPRLTPELSCWRDRPRGVFMVTVWTL